MNDPYSFALTHDWWTWRHPRIRQAFRAAAILHWLPVVTAKLASNAKDGREPNSLKQLCGDEKIRIHERNLKRTFDLENLVAESIPLGLSCRLGIPYHDLCPSSVEWIASATRILCERQISLPEAVTYSRYRTPLLRERPTTTPSWNGKSQENGHASVCLHSVQKVCQVLDPILIDLDSDITTENEACAEHYQRRRRVLPARSKHSRRL